MSKFVTSIPVDVEAIKRSLPPGAFFHHVQAGVGLERVEVVWEHEGLKTPWDYPLEFPAALLGTKQLPAGVIDTRRTTAPDPTGAGKPIAPHKKAGVKSRL
jgi:hypothetical protein